VQQLVASFADMTINKEANDAVGDTKRDGAALHRFCLALCGHDSSDAVEVNVGQGDPVFGGV
jgi:hypothetical protein